ATLEDKLKKTTDILATLGNEKAKHQTLIGFALETDNELEHALDKLRRKNLDYIVLNSIRDTGAGFGVDTNKVSIIDRAGNITSLPLKSKKAVADDICQIIIDHEKGITNS